MNKMFMLAGGACTLAGAGLIGAHLMQGGGTGHLSLQIENKPAVMAAAYKVHANKALAEGRYWVAKVLLTNDGDGDLSNVRVQYRIPDYVDWTTPRPYPAILPGQTVVDLFYPRFPARVAEKLTTSTEQIEIKITYADGDDQRETLRQTDFDFRGRNDLIYTTMASEDISSITDMYENTTLVAAFVTPDDPVIKHFTQQLQQKVLGGTVAGVSNSSEELVRFMKGIYDYWVASGLVYGGTKGLPEQVGNSYTTIQHVRMPREVLGGEAGLCIELATLFSSIAGSAGLDPVIFMTSKHAWPGIRTPDGSIIPIEATAIGGAGIGGVADFEKAIEAGVKNMNVWMAGGDQNIGATIGLIDVGSLHSMGIRPPELADDPALTARLDATMARVTGGGGKKASPPPKQPKVTRTASSGGGAPAPQPAPNPAPVVPAMPSGFANFQHPSGAFSVAYPGNWAAQLQPYPEVPQLAATFAANPMGPGPVVEVYVFDGVPSAEMALQQLNYLIGTLGGYMNTQPSGMVALQGRQYQVFNGQTMLPAMSIDWRGYFRSMGGRTTGIVVSAPSGSLGGYNQMLSQIADTFVSP